MDRYIVQNNVTGPTMVDQAGGKPTQTYLIQQPGTSKLGQGTECEDYGSGHHSVSKMEGDNQFSAKPLDTSQFNEGVGNTTYIIDNNSSNSIDSVRIGNQSFVPVVDSSQLYNISVAGSTAQYTIEGVVNPGLGNYIIEAPAYIVETKPNQTHTMYIQEASLPHLQTLESAPPPQQQQQQQQQHQPPEKAKKKKEKVDNRQHICHLCNAEFTSAASLRCHAYHHNPKHRRFSCIGCERGFEKDKEKEEHELACETNVTGNKFACMFCDLPFSVPKNLRTHENKHRPTKKTKKYKHMCVCIKCNKAFDAIYTLKVHIKKHHNGNAAPDKKKKKKPKVEAAEVENRLDIGQQQQAQGMHHPMPHLDQHQVLVTPKEEQFLVLS